MLLKIHKPFRFQNLLKLFLLYFVLQTGLGNLHKHAELNLHFHAENLLTTDHTTAADKDCSLCPALFSASHFYLSSRTLIYFFNTAYQSLGLEKKSFYAHNYLELNSGRAPPFFTQLTHSTK